jgi:hypothetical protein
MQFGDVEQVRVSGNALDLHSGGFCLEYRLGQNGSE